MKSFVKSVMLPAFAVVLAAASLRASITLTEYTTANFTGPGLAGQSFTISGSGSFTNIGFNFFSDVAATTPSAAGTGFLLSTSYSGNLSSLSSATSGYLGSVAASGGFWNFGSGVTLQGGTQYFFYADNIAFNAAGTTVGTYAGGAPYTGNPPAILSSYDAAFRVTGDAVGVPDGGSTALMLAFAGLGVLLGRRSLGRLNTSRRF